ncbi:CCA-adding tRNA nucleotidyltransferase [Candidatus Kinetoplastibacterium blastocrithidii TCC012E]|uniref:CCA-adding tRNA nucleotidyltransferase n=2 Tax=Candidatus Kinetoplastidibacterium blastocrithidiae TaxID=233181 RepID=M1LCD0_9PROT|nr:CCA-adding tRNA nucleotidyltransferase [Candidatus Kinetoplastibacterium blastocrithidii]AGF50098.1 CCA-adding tRNA nucleotidyltransferase [Candidatus Kinetoplastibacterium blastocrithidii TCC012E]
MYEDKFTHGLEIYAVGGSVRDSLCNLSIKDRDWVVVGSTPYEMENRGFKIVGKNFPVFLHPISREEYALARKEKKVGLGYNGFEFYTGNDVTLEDDLRRRDLTINAIAINKEGEIIDPCGGVTDLNLGILRHVGPAFVEDPLRVIRLARFCAKFDTFQVARDTISLCCNLVNSGEIKYLRPERIWKELSSGLMEKSPAKMIDFMLKTKAIDYVAPELNLNQSVKEALNKFSVDISLAGRYALLCINSNKIEDIGNKLKVPSSCKDYSKLLPLIADNIFRSDVKDSRRVMNLLYKVDFFRRPNRFIELLRVLYTLERFDIDRWYYILNNIVRINIGSIIDVYGKAPLQIKNILEKERMRILNELD